MVASNIDYDLVYKITNILFHIHKIKPVNKIPRGSLILYLKDILNLSETALDESDVEYASILFSINKFTKFLQKIETKDPNTVKSTTGGYL